MPREDRYIPSEEEEKIIRERLETYQRDKQDAVPARDALEKIRASLKTPRPH